MSGRQKVRHRLVRVLLKAAQQPRIAWFRLLSTNRISGSPVRYQPIQAAGFGEIICAEEVKIGVYPSPLFLSTYAYLEARHATARIEIGARTWINNNFRAIAEHTRISIGTDCLIGMDVEVVDSDFHSLRAADRRGVRPHLAEPVSIGNAVFIGSSVKILKGVSIGDNAVVASGSVVTRDIPSNVVAAGVPAVIVRQIEQSP